MPAANFSPLFTRVYEVLVDGAGAARALAAANRFGDEWYPDLPDSQLSILARSKKRVWVALGPTTPAMEHETSATRSYWITLTLSLAYFIEPGARVDTQWRTVAATMATDVHLVRGALTWPGNLSQTNAGAETGLADGKLEFLDYTPSPPNGIDRVWRAVARYRGHITLTH